MKIGDETPQSVTENGYDSSVGKCQRDKMAEWRMWGIDAVSLDRDGYRWGLRPGSPAGALIQLITGFRGSVGF
ncbi:hypothetical protein FOCG_01569 [Fusarium oxysporum f. sp. radicis-lycopersici 26381]|nr:hypothetical protein FOCG_01569 [Fusarium oxysporum f. sp. radicis-lycopersici 26381]